MNRHRYLSPLQVQQRAEISQAYSLSRVDIKHQLEALHQELTQLQMEAAVQEGGGNIMRVSRSKHNYNNRPEVPSGVLLLENQQRSQIAQQKRFEMELKKEEHLHTFKEKMQKATVRTEARVSSLKDVITHQHQQLLVSQQDVGNLHSSPPPCRKDVNQKLVPLFSLFDVQLQKERDSMKLTVEALRSQHSSSKALICSSTHLNRKMSPPPGFVESHVAEVPTNLARLAAAEVRNELNNLLIGEHMAVHEAPRRDVANPQHLMEVDVVDVEAKYGTVFEIKIAARLAKLESKELVEEFHRNYCELGGVVVEDMTQKNGVLIQHNATENEMERREKILNDPIGVRCDNNKSVCVESIEHNGTKPDVQTLKSNVQFALRFKEKLDDQRLQLLRLKEKATRHQVDEVAHDLIYCSFDTVLGQFQRVQDRYQCLLQRQTRSVTILVRFLRGPVARNRTQRLKMAIESWNQKRMLEECCERDEIQLVVAPRLETAVVERAIDASGTTIIDVNDEIYRLEQLLLEQQETISALQEQVSRHPHRIHRPTLQSTCKRVQRWFRRMIAKKQRREVGGALRRRYGGTSFQASVLCIQTNMRAMKARAAATDKKGDSHLNVLQSEAAALIQKHTRMFLLWKNTPKT